MIYVSFMTRIEWAVLHDPIYYLFIVITEKNELYFINNVLSDISSFVSTPKKRNNKNFQTYRDSLSIWARKSETGDFIIIC